VSRRTVFFVSDQTGVTAETLGHSLMTQFEGLEFRPVTLPFVSSVDKAQEALRRINRAAQDEGVRPIIFSTLVQDELRDIVMAADALFLDFFAARAAGQIGDPPAGSSLGYSVGLDLRRRSDDEFVEDFGVLCSPRRENFWTDPHHSGDFCNRDSRSGKP